MGRKILGVYTLMSKKKKRCGGACYGLQKGEKERGKK